MSCWGSSHVFCTLELLCGLHAAAEGCEEDYKKKHALGWKNQVLLLNSGHPRENEFDLASLWRHYCSFIKTPPL